MKTTKQERDSIVIGRAIMSIPPERRLDALCLALIVLMRGNRLDTPEALARRAAVGS